MNEIQTIKYFLEEIGNQKNLYNLRWLSFNDALVSAIVIHHGPLFRQLR